MNELMVKKANGELQIFDEDKLRKSLLFTGANEEVVQKIIDYISPQAYDGITSKSIYNLAFKQLRKISRPLSAYYSTKKALLELGPDGYLFEKFIARLFAHLGFSTQTSMWIEGRCISHEVDVIARSKNKNILVECKFHNSHDRRNDLKTALYVKARATDIKEGQYGSNYDEFWLVSNTSFSDDAIRYSTCAGLHLWGANFPPQNTLQDTIREFGLHPITCLASLKKNEKQMLLDSEILLAKELELDRNLLKDIGIEERRIDSILQEIKKINREKVDGIN